MMRLFVMKLKGNSEVRHFPGERDDAPIGRWSFFPCVIHLRLLMIDNSISLLFKYANE